MKKTYDSVNYSGFDCYITLFSGNIVFPEDKKYMVDGLLHKATISYYNSNVINSYYVLLSFQSSLHDIGFDDLVTIDSCERSPNDCCFIYFRNSKDLDKFDKTILKEKLKSE